MDLVHAQVRMRAIGQADRGTGPRHFLDRDQMLEIAEAQPAPLLAHGDAVQAKFAHGLPQIARKCVFTVDLGGTGLDLLVRKARHGVADHVGGLA